MINFDAIKAEATGQWSGIFAQVGIEVGNGKHLPCPICGGRDRFRFDDKDGRGTWFCNKCGAGDGIKLLMSSFGDDYKGAMNRLAGVLGHKDFSPSTVKKHRHNNARRLLNEVWRSSQPLAGDDLVTKYLRSRRLYMAVNDVRFCPSCYESDSERKMPAMVALVRNAGGKPVSIHRTYLDGPGKAKIRSPKKLMPGTEKLSGCAIRLFDADDIVGVAEGIETAIAARQLFDVPVWATVSSGIMESFDPPKGVRRVVIFGDNDGSFTGQAAAYTLAKRLHAEGYIIEVEIPEKGDWADALIAEW